MHVPTPEPGHHHRALATLAGRFRGSEPAPAGGEEPIGTYDIRVDLDGFALLLDYEQTIAGARRYAMHGVIGWEPVQERYFFHWYDSLGGLGTQMRGRFEDSCLTVEGPDPARGGRARFSFELGAGNGESGFELTMAFSSDGETWENAMVSRYHRVH